jgi:S-adenosylmethionine:tRNA ribosyltransferase-isomerase
MDVAAFGFDLPDELIAQDPPETRGGSRLMMVPRNGGAFAHTQFARLAEYLRPGDLLVLNNTRVFPARLLGTRLPGGGSVECLLLQKLPTPNSATPNPGGGTLGVGSAVWEALVHPGQRLREGTRIILERDGKELFGEVLARRFFGRRSVRLWTQDGSDVDAAIEQIGHIPLPPYIKRDDRPSDRERYQTVYAREPGSIAAPTAGLHFTPELIDELSARGIEHVEVTLHVGYGTFKPIRVEQIEEHVVDAERYTVDADAAAALTQARAEKRRIIAVGTTTVRVVESLPIDEGRIGPTAGETELFIRPGHEFRVVNGLITNFHLPQSSLLVLVAAFAGRERILEAYREAVAQRYRFYSYGDAMLIL